MSVLHVFKNKKVIISAIVVLLTAVLILGAAWAVSANSLEQAKSSAKELVPSGAVLVESDREDDHYELTYYDSTEKMVYEVEVDRRTGKVKELKVRADGILGSDNIVLTEETVRETVAALYPDAEITSVALTESSPRKYVAEFKAAEYSGRVLINPETGAVGEKKIKYGTPVVIPVTSQEPGATSAYISATQAAEAAQALVPGAVVTDIDFDRYGSGYVYEVELYLDGREYEIKLDASTGEKLSMTSHKDDWDGDKWEAPVTGTPVTTAPATDPTQGNSGSTGSDHTASDGNSGTTSQAQPPASSQDIGEERARSLALERAGSGTITEFKRDRDDGRLQYEGEIIGDGMKYEFEIDAYTGTFIKWEEKRIQNGNTGGDIISRDKAVEIALAKAPSATLVKIELDEDDGRLIYEGELRDGRIEYEFEIDAYTGIITDWDPDYDD